MTELTFIGIIVIFLVWIVVETIIALFLHIVFQKLNEYWLAYISAGIAGVIVAIVSNPPTVLSLLILLLPGTFLMGTIFWVCWRLIRSILKMEKTDQLPDQQVEQQFIGQNKPSDDYIVCPKCGLEQTTSNNYCPRCGSKFDNGSQI